MKYTEEQRLDIGRRVYDGELSRQQAAKIYKISFETIRTYQRLYYEKNHLPPKTIQKDSGDAIRIRTTKPKSRTLEEYEAMSKEELIQELVKARITEARLKKGYEVKGDGSITLYNRKNTK